MVSAKRTRWLAGTLHVEPRGYSLAVPFDAPMFGVSRDKEHRRVSASAMHPAGDEHGHDEGGQYARTYENCDHRVEAGGWLRVGR